MCTRIRTRWIAVALVGMIFLLALTGQGRGDGFENFPDQPEAYYKPSAERPNTALEVHKINRMAFTVTNSGFFGAGYFRGNNTDPETGRRAMSCEYPINSNIEYLFSGALWFGAVVGSDTLVSTGATFYNWGITELWPDAGEAGNMVRRSTQPYSLHYHPDALSEEDIYAEYADTLVDPTYVRMDPVDNRPHKPLNIEVSQKSYAWSYPYAEDFVLMDFKVKNIGEFPLKQLYIGVVVEAIVFHTSKEGSDNTWLDDICGYKETIPSPFWPGYEDTVRIAWVADNDGDPVGRFFDYTSATSVTGVRVIRTPSDSLKYSYNWWITHFNTADDWGPRQVTDDKPFRYFGTTFGSPAGDRNKYYMLSTPEFDYDQLECAISHGNGWMPPAEAAEDYADGHNPIYLLSFGPFDVDPDSTLPFTLAYIAGEDFHTNPTAFRDLYSPAVPEPYMEQLNFNDLGYNSVWADWIYDNPGYDTDNDGDSGLARWFYNDITGDSVYAYYKGDGVPDFRGASPPPSPRLKVYSDYGKLTLRFNGQLTEEYVDIFSKLKDFEGYKIYLGEDNRLSDFVLIATYDKRNYNRYQWDIQLNRWEVSDVPLDYDSIINVYGQGFDPEMYTIDHPLEPDDPRNVAGVYTYFTPQNWNESELSPYGFHKVYPDADLADSADTTEDGLHRFYEYEYVINDLAPAKPVYVAVTAFDFGSRTHFLSALESSPLLNAVSAYPLTSSEEVHDRALGVIVYPNPYRISDGYASDGYENRDRTKSAERARTIHFANLPAICKIRIFTLNGDLVQEIDHYYPEGGPRSMEETWNVISRNTQAVVTGIYIWSVRSEMGDQLGKLVIMK